MEKQVLLCPQCQGELIVLESGKTICRACAVNNGLVETPKKPNSDLNSIMIIGLLSLGLMWMFISFYRDSTICYNDGKNTNCEHPHYDVRHQKTNGILLGGFLYLGACVLSLKK